jgi:predicted nuclease of restriction endonuclease-like (RecB) superfamily
VNADLTFEGLVQVIRRAHQTLTREASRAVNISLTVRNWLIGYYVVEYEQHGADRANYGERLLDELASTLAANGVLDVAPRTLRLFRQFYLIYPQIRQSLVAKSGPIVLPLAIRQTLGAKSSPVAVETTAKVRFQVSPGTLLSGLSFTHFVQLLSVEAPLARTFYEAESIRGQWSVRELRRQITSLLFERTGLSINKAKLLELTQQGAETDAPSLTIRDPYVFEFLGIKPSEVMGESQLEDALLDRVQEFLLELGRGFCFEARQKRILIGDDFFFVDLVFYHRILKCHVLIDLKVDEFRHEHLGQMNTYVNWYRKNEMAEGDQPPVGILLCMRKNQALVEYALAGMDNQLFVSRYQLELPKKEELERLLEAEMSSVEPAPETER